MVRMAASSGQATLSCTHGKCRYWLAMKEILLEARRDQGG